jgi:hypothetical protein
MAIWRMRIAYWIPKATDTHLEYVMLMAYPLQQGLHERSSVLRYSYIACVVLLLYVDCIIVIRHRDDCHGRTRTRC